MDWSQTGSIATESSTIHFFDHLLGKKYLLNNGSEKTSSITAALDIVKALSPDILGPKAIIRASEITQYVKRSRLSDVQTIAKVDVLLQGKVLPKDLRSLLQQYKEIQAMAFSGSYADLWLSFGRLRLRHKSTLLDFHGNTPGYMVLKDFLSDQDYHIGPDDDLRACLSRFLGDNLNRNLSDVKTAFSTLSPSCTNMFLLCYICAL